MDLSTKIFFATLFTILGLLLIYISVDNFNKFAKGYGLLSRAGGLNNYAKIVKTKNILNRLLLGALSIMGIATSLISLLLAIYYVK